ncbi:MAG: ribonuclease J [Firmicutes bacterium]|nr:ribonuclease J [Bacillota bacterium]
MNEPDLKVIFLGGVGEIGKNMTALEFGEEIIVIDCGLAFPSSEMPGIDLVIPDASYLIANREKVKGIVLTHAHEDHIGALPYILKELNVPVYGTRMTMSLLEPKLREHKILENARLNTVKPKSVVHLGGGFKVEFISVTHSVAGSCALSITTPIGVVFHTGDFKIDHTPIDGVPTDLSRIAEIGNKGVLLLLGESTNVERKGSSMSEATVGSSLHKVFAEQSTRRIFVATFASNVHRIQQLLDLAQKFNRKVAFSGRSMLNVVEAATKIGELKYNNDLIVDIEKIGNHEDKHLLIITTGSQGEPMSALTRMACDEFTKVKIGYNDVIVISASPIPGNERLVYGVINKLYRLGARVIYESFANVHVSGHAYADELSLIHTLVKPKFFIPVHGEYRHLKKHAELAMKMGMPSSNIVLCDLGNVASVSKRAIRLGDNVTAGPILVDGIGVGDVGSAVIRDRKTLSEDGLVMVGVSVCSLSGTVQDIEILTKGFVYVKESEDLLTDSKDIVRSVFDKYDSKSDMNDFAQIKNQIRKDLKGYLYKRTHRNPMIIVMVLQERE